MIKSINDTATLNNGVKMPWFGLGVYKAEEGEEVGFAVRTAIETGYRAIDTAALYGNERGVGKAVKDSGIKREDIFITTKVWNDHHGSDLALKAFDESRKKLNMDYLDLYLIHWPGKDKYKDTWKALEKLYKDGYVRAIGVSNFQIHHLEDLIADSEFIPMVNQVEYHPRLTQKNLYDYCKKQGIQLEAWSPIMKGRLTDNPTLIELGKKYGKTPSQVILRWDLEKEVITIPKSVNKNRIIENANIFDFQLEKEDIETIDQLNQNNRVGLNPDNFSF